MRIVIFGGAFDPPHWGHINLVRSVRGIIKPDKTIIIPTGNAPHKSTATCFEKRFKLAKAAFPDCEVSDIENNPKKSYTVDTLKKLHEIYPGSELFLIIGSDMLASFRNWKNHEQILDLCTVVAAARRSSEFVELTQFTGEDSPIKLLDIDVVEMSSSQIRENFTEKRYTHSINVAIMCAELSKKHQLTPELSQKAYIAGILHDIKKKSRFLPENEFNPTPEEIAEPKLWHAIAGAVYVRDVLGIHDPDILNGIRFHTIARDNMNKTDKISLVEKIVYIADKISAERTGVEDLRALAFENLDLAIQTEITQKTRRLQK
jgi:nicotinate-nucleotide adenylyltransferase